MLCIPTDFLPGLLFRRSIGFTSSVSMILLFGVVNWMLVSVNASTSPCGLPLQLDEDVPWPKRSRRPVPETVLSHVYRSILGTQTRTLCRSKQAFRKAFCIRSHYPKTPCIAYMPTLGWFGGSMGRHIFQSHGVSGLWSGFFGSSLATRRYPLPPPGSRVQCIASGSWQAQGQSPVGTDRRG